MNTFKIWAFALFAVISSCTLLTSCDEDVSEAANLNGQWRGNFCMEYSRNGLTWRADYTILEFFQTGFTNHGTGKQIDFYSGYRCPIRSEYFDFDWSVRNGVLMMRYPYNHQLDVDIYDYEMTSRMFTGRIGDSGLIFTMDKYKDYDWNNYNDRYFYDYNPYY